MLELVELATLDTVTELLDVLLDLLLAIDVMELATDELVPPPISLLIAANKLFAPVASCDNSQIIMPLPCCNANLVLLRIVGIPL